MPIGIAIFTKKNEINSELSSSKLVDFVFPHDFSIGSGLINNILNYILSQSNQKINQMAYGDKFIIIAKLTPEECSEESYLFLILNADEKHQIKDFQDYLDEKSIIFNCDNREIWDSNFNYLARKIFFLGESKKLVFIGLPASGKTCIKKVFFDKEDPLELLGTKVPEPTRGFAHYVHTWVNANVGIIDSAGQELDLFTSPSNFQERELIFEDVDAIIFVFDIEGWMSDKENILQNLEKVVKSKNELAPNGLIYAFCHKIDLLEGSTQERASFYLEIKEIIETKFGLTTLFTSIQPESVHTIYRSMQMILNNLSLVGNSIETKCDHFIANSSNCALFILNDQGIILCIKSTDNVNFQDFPNLLEKIQVQASKILEISD